MRTVSEFLVGETALAALRPATTARETLCAAAEEGEEKEESNKDDDGSRYPTPVALYACRWR